MTQEQAYKIFKSVGGIDYCDEYDCRHLELHYEELLAFAHAVLRAQQVAVPDGYALVPIEPTPAILDAMSSSGWKTACYKAMLVAAQGKKP